VIVPQLMSAIGTKRTSLVALSTPNLSDLIIDCAAKFLRYALNLLPRICAILAFEREDIDYPKQAKEKDKTKEKLAHA
jgi:hypothetical protein